MKLEELLEAAKSMVVTPEQVRRVEERLKEYDKRLTEGNQITTEFLNRTYNL